MNTLEFFKNINLKKVPIIKTKAMWCGHRSHKDYSNRLPWIIKKACDKFGFKVYVEIGVAYAGGIHMAYDFLSHKKDSIIIGIDPLFKPKTQKTAKDKIFLKENVHLIRKKSRDALEETRCLIRESGIDILIIDGKHTYECSLLDFEEYMPMVNVGGIVWFDDIAYISEVGRAWSKIKNYQTSCKIPYEVWHWDVGEIEGGKKVNGTHGLDGSWIIRTG